ncbi:MAG: hypothetical protein K9L98_00125 [Candidatus Pacebacteria bacterium]|nr:hypothetical protein [Candidatus Paceibacterota bacterium]MCF7862410.1 hypothetical protein [Candidatus Paceibacterota bacterium]
MIDIKDLLAKYKNKMGADFQNKEKIAQVLSEIVGVLINKEEVEIKNKVLVLKIKTIYKNTALVKKEKILNKLKEEFGDGAPIDIL